VNAPFLTLLAVILAALLGLGAVGAAWPRRTRLLVGHATAGAACLGGLLSLVALLLDDAPATLTLPLGLPGGAFELGLDPLASYFALLIFVAGAATAAFAAATGSAAGSAERGSAERGSAERGSTATGGATTGPAAEATDGTPRDDPNSIAHYAPGAVPVALAGLGLAVLAADAPTRAAGLAIAGTAVWALGARDRARAAQLGVALLCAAAVAASSVAPEPAALWLALVGPGALAGLAPLHRWLIPTDRVPGHRAPAPAAALLSGGLVPAAIAAILRMLLQPEGAAPPGWWGLPLVVLGAASVLAGGLAATRHEEVDAALAAVTPRQTGLAAIGIGVALTARAADLPGVTAMALGAVLLLTAVQAVSGTLLALAAGAIVQGAGTRRLDRLGGLVHRMPGTSAALLAGLFSAAAFPPGANFAALWLLFQALLALPRAGGLAFQLVLCALAAMLGLAGAVSAAGALRMVGVVCLGRPRTPRGAAADEPARGARRSLLALAAAAVALGVFVGPFLHLLADAPIRALAGTGLGSGATVLGLAPGAESPGYAALPLASLLLLAAGLVLWLRRLRGITTAGGVSGPAWEDGFAAAPNWLPFGNPLTQTAGVGFDPTLPAPVISAGVTRAPTVGAMSMAGMAGVGMASAAATRACMAAAIRAAARTLRPSAPAVTLILLAAILTLCAWIGTS
jgi:formate hydrogenlyase subunit 3/multisubunit Na+/H+ antiporter MnhD subunit